MVYHSYVKQRQWLLSHILKHQRHIYCLSLPYVDTYRRYAMTGSIADMALKAMT